MSGRNLQDWVSDIYSAMRNIEADMGDMTETEFLDDGKTIRAVAKSITDIGECAHQIMETFPGFKDTQPAIWSHLSKVYAMRIKLTHGYFGLDAGVVWSTAKNSLPVFESVVGKLTK